MIKYRLITIVLAAGESRRMGHPKLFLPLYGSTLLKLAVTAAMDLNQDDTVVVVTGAYDAQIREHLSGFESIHYTYNSDWSSGMGSSIATGLAKAAELHPTHFLISLADQPSMGTESLAFLADESLRYPDQIVATKYPERLGVPAIFPALFAEQLRSASGTFGARQLIASEGNRVRGITFDQPPADVDTPEDYARLLDKKPPE